MQDRQTMNALNAGSMWTAKWLADLGDDHEGTDTEHLVRSAQKALRLIEDAKATDREPVTLLPAAEQLISDAIWRLDSGETTRARQALCELLDRFGDPERD